MPTLQQHHTVITGRPGGPTIVFSHGFGCDQRMWRLVAPTFEADHRVVLFDHIGAGRSDLTAYDPSRYDSLDGYADDVVQLCSVLGGPVVFVGHSVSASIGIIAARRAPELFSALVLVGPSPRYIDDADYRGGFSADEIADLLDSMDANFLGWSTTMAPVIVGNPDQPALGEELAESFCRTDPAIARHFARVTFMSDNRADLPHVTVPTLVLQCRQDVIAPECVGDYIAGAIPGSVLRVLDATGHCPHLSHPAQTIDAIRSFVGELVSA
jgi:sigma-B regulation protein RsbQ